MKIKMGDSAVAEIIGAIILLGITIAIFSIILTNVLSDDGPVPNLYSTIIGRAENGEVIFEHQRGQGIGIDSIISLFYNGSEIFRGPISALLDSGGIENGIWDIGERLIYTPDPIIIPPIIQNQVQISGTIADMRTNSLAFWGILQPGYVEPPGGRGGIWHLDEGTGVIAHDSSGNNNHGYVHGSIWTAGKSDDALFFNGEYTDYIRVLNGPGLFITDEITVEAWIKPSDTTSGIIDSFDFNNKSAGITWIHISGDIFAFAYWYPGIANQINCRIQTVNLSPYGQIGDKAIDSINFIANGSANGFDPDFIHISDSVYALAHRFQKDNGYVTTLNIYEDGSISDNIIDRSEFQPDPSNAFNPDIIHVSGNIYAIASSENRNGKYGNITTLEIAPDGNINPIIIDRFKFESTYNCSFPRISKISDTKYIVAYSRGDNGSVISIEIENNGSINKTIIDSFQFESNRCFETDLVNVSSDSSNQSNIYAIAYRGLNDNGYVTTIEVKDNGTINKNIVDILKFDPSVYGGQPDIEHIEDFNHTFAIAYLGPGDHGYLTTIKIFDDGAILDNIIDTFQFTNDENEEMEPTIVHVSEHIYGIAYKGKKGYGYLISVSINEQGEVEGTEGFGGIFKDNSYALIANATMAFATINNFTINTTGILPNNWNHIALTYDGVYICLYINNTENSVKISYQYPYDNKKINFTDDDLYFGYLFFGCLDEIAIFDRALSDQEIYNHYSNPGVFENNQS